ncbi:MAG: pyrroline-5-carboxylate reductase [Bacillota bacterium]
MYKLGFIGAGVMAGAILDRIIDNIEHLDINVEDIAIYDLSTERCDYFAAKGVNVAQSANEICKQSEMVLLGVKPQFYADILAKIEEFNCKIVLSIMAGIKISTLKSAIKAEVGIVRMMPNTPCQVGKGVIAMCFDNICAQDKKLIASLMGSCGSTLEISDNQFDAVTSVSGSGPAYVYMFAEGLIQGGIAGGLSYEQSRLLALKTIEGTAILAANSPLSTDILVEKVCSKGGTTIEAVNSFRNDGLVDILKKGVEKCRARSQELSDNL